MARTKLRLTVIVSRPYLENTYVASLDDRSDCLVVDPGLEPQKVLAHLDEKCLHPVAILCTHGHFDHTGGCAAMKQRWPDCPLVRGTDASPVLIRAMRNVARCVGLRANRPRADVVLGDGETFEAAGFRLEVRQILGHWWDHVVFIWSAGSPTYVFSGDVLFHRSVGRTFPLSGGFGRIRSGIQGRLFCLPDDTVVLPGHGRPTTIGDEKRWNPFVGTAAPGRLCR